MNVTFVHNHRRSKLNRIGQNINLTQVNSLYGQRSTEFGNRTTERNRNFDRRTIYWQTEMLQLAFRKA